MKLTYFERFVVFKTNYSTLAQIRADHSEEQLVNWLNQFFSNQNYRKGYNKSRNEAFKQVKADPRFKDLLKQVRTDARKSSK